MSVAQTMVKMAALPDILRAAQLLEKYGLLPPGEQAADVVKRYVEANQDINEALARSAYRIGKGRCAALSRSVPLDRRVMPVFD